MRSHSQYSVSQSRFWRANPAGTCVMSSAKRQRRGQQEDLRSVSQFTGSGVAVTQFTSFRQRPLGTSMVLVDLLLLLASPTIVMIPYTGNRVFLSLLVIQALQHASLAHRFILLVGSYRAMMKLRKNRNHRCNQP